MATTHLPGLNGLRAISALAVVLSHLVLSLDSFGLDRKLLGTFRDGTARGSDLATFGVTIFFTLSGFLITTLLLQEQERTGTVSVGRFYMRRILRIWPLYYTYIGIAILTLILCARPWDPHGLPFYLLLLANVPRMFGGEIPLIDHLWSIGVEEQFYLLWPLLVLSIGDRRKLGYTMFMVLAVMLAGLLVARFALQPAGIMTPSIILGTSRFQCMLIGCSAAIVHASGAPWFGRIFRSKGLRLLAWASMASIAFNRFPAPAFIANELVSVITVVLIIDQIAVPRALVPMENRVLDLLGRVSYSTYVWHPLVIFLLSRSVPFAALDVPLRYPAVFLATLSGTLAVAWLSYRYIESPILRLKDRYAVVHSRAHMADPPHRGLHRMSK